MKKNHSAESFLISLAVALILAAVGYFYPDILIYVAGAFLAMSVILIIIACIYKPTPVASAPMPAFTPMASAPADNTEPTIGIEPAVATPESEPIYSSDAAAMPAYTSEPAAMPVTEEAPEPTSRLRTTFRPSTASYTESSSLSGAPGAYDSSVGSTGENENFMPAGDL